MEKLIIYILDLTPYYFIYKPLPLRTSREPDPLRSSVPLEIYEE